MPFRAPSLKWTGGRPIATPGTLRGRLKSWGCDELPVPGPHPACAFGRRLVARERGSLGHLEDLDRTRTTLERNSERVAHVYATIGALGRSSGGSTANWHHHAASAYMLAWIVSRRDCLRRIAGQKGSASLSGFVIYTQGSRGQRSVTYAGDPPSWRCWGCKRGTYTLFRWREGELCERSSPASQRSGHACRQG